MIFRTSATPCCSRLQFHVQLKNGITARVLSTQYRHLLHQRTSIRIEMNPLVTRLFGVAESGKPRAWLYGWRKKQICIASVITYGKCVSCISFSIPARETCSDLDSWYYLMSLTKNDCVISSKPEQKPAPWLMTVRSIQRNEPGD